MALLPETGIDVDPESFLDTLATAYANHEATFTAQGFAPIRDAWLGMAALLREAGSRAAEITESSDSWHSRARAAMDAVIRKSVEMRLVATLTPE